jgi:hypothetical protein
MVEFNSGQRDIRMFVYYDQIVQMRSSRNFEVKFSTLPSAGRGCFTKRAYEKGEFLVVKPKTSICTFDPLTDADEDCTKFVNDAHHFDMSAYFTGEPVDEDRLKLQWDEYMILSEATANVEIDASYSLFALRDLVPGEELFRNYGVANLIAHVKDIDSKLTKIKESRFKKDLPHIEPSEDAWITHFSSDITYLFDKETYFLCHVIYKNDVDLLDYPMPKLGEQLFGLSDDELVHVRCALHNMLVYNFR